MYQEIINAAIEEFDENGIRFTMDNLAKRMRISKRTLYSHIESKEKLIEDIIELTFKSIKEQEKDIMDNEELDIVEKLKSVLCIMPRNIVPIDYKRIHEIKEFYPKQYKRIEQHLSIEWENTLYLVEEGIRQEKLREIKPAVFRQIILGTYINMLGKEFLSENNISYQEAAEELIDIIMNGIVRNRG